MKVRYGTYADLNINIYLQWQLHLHMNKVVMFDVRECLCRVRGFPMKRCFRIVTIVHNILRILTCHNYIFLVLLLLPCQLTRHILTKFEFVRRRNDSISSQHFSQILRLVNEFGGIGFAKRERVVWVRELSLWWRHFHSLWYYECHNI